MIVLKSRATVYTENPSTKIYDVVAKQNLRCFLQSVGGAQTVLERAQMNAMRRFYWDGNYQMPAFAQIQVGSQRWQIMQESITEYTGNIGERVAIYGCDVTMVTA